MTTSPVVSVTDELVAELEEACREHGQGFMIETGEVLALLAERAELKRDAERYRWLKAQGFATIKPENGEVTLFTVASQHVDAPNLDAAIDAAMQSEDKP